MVKKIGKINYLLLVSFFISCAIKAATPAVSLELVDKQGNFITEIGIGMSFSAQVTVSGDTRSLPQATLQGIDQFSQSGTSSGTRMQSINGVTTVSEQTSVSLRADRPGTYEVGPAVINYNGQEICSDTIKIEVVANYKGDKKETDDGAFFARIEVDKEEVYVGQPINITIRFYQNTQHVSLEGIEKPHFDEYFFGKELVGPEAGTAYYNNKKYRCIEWKTTLYPKKPGEALIAPIQVVYSEKIDRHGMSDMFGMMQSFFGSMRQNQQLSSNSVKIQVKDLPLHDTEVKAVGNFSSLSASLNNAHASEGEGLIYRLTLEGAGNLELIGHQKIMLPEELTYYDSSARIEEKPVGKKTFEYVIQGLKPGEFIIPAQTITYFDLETESYKTVQSEPVSLTITPSAGPKITIDQQSKENVLNENNLEQISFKDIKNCTDWSPLFYVPWWLFLLLLIVPFFGFVGCSVFFIYKKRLGEKAPELRYRYAFKQARILFYHAKSKGYAGQLYHMYKELFSARLRMQTYEISENFIEDFLQTKGFTEDQIIQWRLHFGSLAEQAFLPHHVDQKDSKLFNEAVNWIDQLEKVL